MGASELRGISRWEALTNHAPHVRLLADHDVIPRSPGVPAFPVTVRPDQDSIAGLELHRLARSPFLVPLTRSDMKHRTLACAAFFRHGVRPQDHAAHGGGF